MDKVHGLAPIDRLLARLKNVIGTRPPYSAQCPAHDDQHNSLSVTAAGDGKALVHCHAGCEAEQIVAAVGRKMADLFPEQPATGSGFLKAAIVQSPGCTLEQYSIAKRLPINELRDCGLRDTKIHGRSAILMPYRSPDGHDVAVRFRTAIVGESRFVWRRGSRPCLYGLDQLPRERKRVVIVEGESDTHTLQHHGIAVLGVPGAGNWKEERDAEHLAQFEEILVVREPDRGGDTLCKALANSTLRSRIRVATLDGFKDVSEMHIDNPNRFLERWDAAVGSAVSITLLKETEIQAARRSCRELANEPHILDLFAADIAADGLVGEERNAKIVLLALVSRVLPKPANLAIKGHSASGKSFIVDRVLSFVPDDAYIALTASSEKALIYMEDDIQHRILVVYEAAGVGEDFAAYVMRSLSAKELFTIGPRNLRREVCAVELSRKKGR